MKYNRNLIKRVSVYFCLAVLMSMQLNILGAPGCQDNSKHLERGTIDYKQWHYVACNCPCEKLYQIRPDGHCPKCEHWRTRIRLVRTKEIRATALLNVPELEAWSGKRIE